jgi:hypothetical protein
VKTHSTVVFVVLLGLARGAAVEAPPGASALQARAVLPPDAINKVAVITACEGRPVPERWRFLVWDATAENGFREYVVADGRVVAKNLVSQFATQVNPQDVLSPEAIRVDSDKVAWLALMYASTNNLLVSSLHFSLRQTPELSTPVWKVDCFDGTQQQVGSISVAANEGKVLAHLGFTNEPSPTVLAAIAGVEGTKPKPSSKKRTTASKPASRTPPPEAVAERNPSDPRQLQRAKPADNRNDGLSKFFRSIFRPND